MRKMTSEKQLPTAKPAGENESPIVIYTAEDNNIQLDVKLDGETVWLSIEQMAILFGRDRTVVSRHIRNIYSEGELPRDITCANFAHMGVDQDQVYETQLYNLDVIIFVGYRVKSIQGTRFRQWASKVLKDYLIKGYAVNQKIALRHYDELKKVVTKMTNNNYGEDSIVQRQKNSYFLECGGGKMVFFSCGCGWSLNRLAQSNRLSEKNA
ncbi:MAG: virulence RhuM family protein [Bacteroidales bacterium]|nr:virulence RhuM family protein [Bacteroidales bacterium]